MAMYTHLSSTQLALKEEFHANGLDSVVTIECRDACEQGFPDNLEGKVDVVFLDLPCPWKAVGHAKQMLKHNGAFASYSPCMEQVQKTCDALRLDGFDRVRTIETRLMPYSTRTVTLPLPSFTEEYQRKQKRSHEESEVETNQELALKLAKRDDEMRGHTAFLTFAYKF
ncbi:hypothetical protein Ae201684P_000032 [Aphanomyces euteiches]|nr:hypothetical protein Ae201684P_000032 [Aphanomyces euteiches]